MNRSSQGSGDPWRTSDCDILATGVTVHLFLLDCQIQQVQSVIGDWIAILGWIWQSSPNEVNNYQLE